MTENPYKFNSSSFGKLKVGDFFLHDAVFGISEVLGVRVVEGTEFPAVHLIVRQRSLHFEKDAYEDYTRFPNTSILRFKDEPVLRATLPSKRSTPVAK